VWDEKLSWLFRVLAAAEHAFEGELAADAAFLVAAVGVTGLLPWNWAQLKAAA